MSKAGKFLESIEEDTKKDRMYVQIEKHGNRLNAIFNTNGIDNCMFLVAMRPVRRIMGIGFTDSSDSTRTVPCRISERTYKIKDNYKITLVSMYEGFGQEHFYVSDLAGLIRSGSIKMYTEVK